MSILVVEPGDGTDPLANTYVTLAEFAAYWTERGFDYTTYATPAIERALVVATDYIELNFGRSFRGYPLEEDQPLSFPRQLLYDGWEAVEGIPIELKRAQFEYAKRALTNADGLMPDPADRDETGAVIVKRFEKIGPIETDTTYLTNTAQSLRTYPAADRWLCPFLKNSNGRIRN